MFRLVVADHDMVVGEVVLDEPRRVLEGKLGVARSVVSEVVELLERFEVVPRPEGPASAEADEDDRWILTSARHGRAGVLVTGDCELLALRELEGMRIESPRGLWELLRKG